VNPMSGTAAAGPDQVGRHEAQHQVQRPDVSEQTVGQLLGEVSRDLSTLMRQEVELAKAEIKTEVAKAGKGAGMLGGAGFAGYLFLLFLSCAAWWGLANVMDPGWAALIVAVVWGVVAAVLAATGRATLKRVNPKPERTIETAKEIPPALKGQA
jgi:Putative Actinobacterial Holin-X, holin superfamily III